MISAFGAAAASDSTQPNSLPPSGVFRGLAASAADPMTMTSVPAGTGRRSRAGRQVDGQGGEEPADLGGPVQGQARAADHHRRVGAVRGDGSQAGQGLAPAHVVADQHPAVRQGEPDHRVLLRLERRPVGQAGHRDRVGLERGGVGAVLVLSCGLGDDRLAGLLADLQAESLR